MHFRLRLEPLDGGVVEDDAILRFHTCHHLPGRGFDHQAGVVVDAIRRDMEVEEAGAIADHGLQQAAGRGLVEVAHVQS